MDWLSWLSKSDCLKGNPRVVHEYGLAFALNQLEEDDIPYLDHPFLQSIGISVPKHRLEILKLVHHHHSSRRRSVVSQLVKNIKLLLTRSRRPRSSFMKNHHLLLLTHHHNPSHESDDDDDEYAATWTSAAHHDVVNAARNKKKKKTAKRQVSLSTKIMDKLLLVLSSPSSSCPPSSPPYNYSNNKAPIIRAHSFPATPLPPALHLYTTPHHHQQLPTNNVGVEEEIIRWDSLFRDLRPT